MVVKFVTDGGHRYVLDHGQKTFSHHSKEGVDEIGPLWNAPVVVKGKRAEILTKPRGRGVIRMIQTGIVREREVILD